jgi:large subunit ribosomal protein L4
MIEIPVLNTRGESVGARPLDPAALGGRVRVDLLKQAVVAYRASRRLGTVNTKSRGMVAGSTRKLYRQKGTGRARAGNLRTPVRVGGGRAFAKVNRDFSQKLSRRMRRLARNSAILAKAMSGAAAIVEGIRFEAPKTSQMDGILRAVKAERGALLALATADPNVLKSGRNLPTLSLRLVSDMNAYDVLKARRLLFTPEAFEALLQDPERAGAPAQG